MTFRHPDFSDAESLDAPNARFESAPADGVLPEGFFATTNLPTYVKVRGKWKLPHLPRMDGVIILEDNGSLRVLEGRYVKKGQPVAVGLSEDGGEGIYVHTNAFLDVEDEESDFAFMRTEVSREKPVDYVEMAELMRKEKERGGYIVWVLGPAILHSRGRDNIIWFIENGYVSALLGGNAVGVHDIEQALLGTTLGMDRSGRPVTGGHSYHVRAINRIRRAGSIRNAVEQGILKNGIMYTCVKHDVPFVLAGSIRDDGPLPDTINDMLRAQELMRAQAEKATMAIMIATALHSIGFGNMLPAYTIEDDGSLRPLTTIAVDSSEFVVSKLKDRGTHQAFGVITNAQDFLHVLRFFVEAAEVRELERAGKKPKRRQSDAAKAKRGETAKAHSGDAATRRRGAKKPKGGHAD